MSDVNEASAATDYSRDGWACSCLRQDSDGNLDEIRIHEGTTTRCLVCDAERPEMNPIDGGGVAVGLPPALTELELEQLRDGLRDIVSNTATYGEAAGEFASEVLGNDPDDERPDRDECGNNWYPHTVAIRWPVGVSVVCRRRQRGTGELRYSLYTLFDRWQGAGSGEFQDDEDFLMLPRRGPIS